MMKQERMVVKLMTDSTHIEFEESKGEVNLDESAWLIYGPPKIGKSNFASGWPNSIFLCTSKKEVSRLKVPYYVVNEHKKLVDAVDHLVANKKKYGRAIITLDFVDAMYTNCQVYVCKKLRIDHASEAGYGKGVDMIDLEFKKVINKLIGSGYGCIFISHLQVKDVTTMQGVVTKTISTLPERARRIINPLVSVIGYLDFETVKVKDPETGKVSFKKRRMMTFEPSEYLEAGDRDGYLPEKIPCFQDPKKTYALIKDYYTGKKHK